MCVLESRVDQGKRAKCIGLRHGTSQLTLDSVKSFVELLAGHLIVEAGVSFENDFSQESEIFTQLFGSEQEGLVRPRCACELLTAKAAQERDRAKD